MPPLQLHHLTVQVGATLLFEKRSSLSRILPSGQSALCEDRGTVCAAKRLPGNSGKAVWTGFGLFDGLGFGFLLLFPPVIDLSDD